MAFSASTCLSSMACVATLDCRRVVVGNGMSWEKSSHLESEEAKSSPGLGKSQNSRPICGSGQERRTVTIARAMPISAWAVLTSGLFARTCAKTQTKLMPEVAGPANTGKGTHNKRGKMTLRTILNCMTHLGSGKKKTFQCPGLGQDLRFQATTGTRS